MIRLATIALIVSLFVRGFGFIDNPIPLGYDPGLYKDMFLEYAALGSQWDFTQLPPRIQSAYEPRLGMIGSLVQHLGIWFADNRLTWGRVGASMMIILGAYLLAGTIHKKVWLLALILVSLSFSQYAAYRWAYWKQILGLFLVCVTLRSRSKTNIRQTIPLLIAISLFNRASATLLVFIGIVWWCILLYRRDYTVLVELLLSCFVAEMLFLPIMFPFIKTQILPIVQPFLSSIDLPTIQDGYQAWGTFLTTTEYLYTTRPIIITGLCGLSILLWKRSHNLIIISSIILLLRVFGQGFFFQRMIGYLDIFLCITAAYACYHLLDIKRGKGIVVWILALQSYYLWYWYRIIHPPIIEKQEFAFIKSIGTTLSWDSTIIVPGIWYSPWIKWRTDAQVLAPGLFDVNHWWDDSQWWMDYRYGKNAHTKCSNLAAEYPQLVNTPTYVWIGSKQPQTESYSWWCFVRLSGSNLPPYSWYQIDWKRMK